MIRPAALCVIPAAALLAGAGVASASTTDLKLSSPMTGTVTGTVAKPPPAGWRGFKTGDGGYQLTFSPEGPGTSALTLSCRAPAPTVEIQAPAVSGTSASAAIRLTSGGFVRVFFAKSSPDAGDGMIITHAPVSDEMLQMFRKTGRIVAGRMSLFARTLSEKAAVEDFFAGCAPGSVATP